uniref:Uncharacterized protein n=1 Tax=Glossina austeni TaxID=7395 RepID=A0A1A9V9Q5_GLOAU
MYRVHCTRTFCCQDFIVKTAAAAAVRLQRIYELCELPDNLSLFDFLYRLQSSSSQCVRHTHSRGLCNRLLARDNLPAAHWHNAVVITLSSKPQISKQQVIEKFLAEFFTVLLSRAYNKKTIKIDSASEQSKIKEFNEAIREPIPAKA